MNAQVAIFRNELRSNRGWYLSWIITSMSLSFMYMATYPGLDGMQTILDLLDEPIFQAFVGDIGGESPGLALWMALTVSTMVLLFAIAATLTGAKVIAQSLSDNTGEIIHSLPISRTQFLTSRLLAGLFAMILMLLGWVVPLLIPIKGETIDFDRVVGVTWWGIIYVFAFLSIGLLAGVVYGQAGKGQLNSLIIILLLYTVNSIANVVEEIQTLNKANPLNWYTPSDVFFGHDIETDLILKLLLVIFITGILAVLAYNKRDLLENSPFLSLSLRRNKRGDDQSDIPKVKSNKNSFFTFWVKPLERKYPILADFVYSERRVLLITFIALTLFYPLQLMTYDEETITKIITDFGDIPLFTYGHLINDQPYLWFLTTQAVGVHWMYFVPLMLHWIKKIVSWDAEGGTGEIIGVQLVKRSDVVFQRTLAVGLEIIWIVVIEVIYLIISETVVDATLGLSWEILAITGKISLYYFLLVLTVGISFYLPEYKSLAGRVLFLTIFASFVIGISSESTDNMFTRGIFGLYDPVLIMRDQTFTAIIGILVLAILILPGILFLKSQSEKFEWINT